MSTFDDMMRAAQTALGTRYVWGGNSLTNGVDCSGFVQQVFASIGVNLPRVSNLQARSGSAVGKDQAQAGDLVWWDLNGRNDGADHIGIYLGNGKVMEASSSRGQVVIRNLWGNAQFSRVPGTGTGTPTAMGAAPGAGARPGGVPTEAPPPPRPQTGLDPMASLSEGGALNLGDLRQSGGDDEADDPFDLERLYALVDEDDPGEGEDTVGPYNVARLMMDRFNSAQAESIPQPAPAPQPTANPRTKLTPAGAARFSR